MATQRFLNLVAGKIQQVIATVTSAGAANAGQIVALDAGGHLDPTVMPPGIGADTASILASESLAAGAVVNVWSNAGTQNARNADGSAAGKEVTGYVQAAVSSGAMATVYFGGQITGLTGLTPGGAYYLSDTTPGTLTNTAPTTAAHVAQQVGIATSPSSVEFRPLPSVLLA